MVGYLVRRLLLVVPLVVLVSIFTFGLILIIPGDPVAAMLGTEAVTADERTIQAMRQELGLDRPIPVQYAMWMGKVVRGNLGRGIFSKQPVAEAIGERLPVTLQIGVFAWVISIFIAIPGGIIAAVKRNSLADIAASVIAIAGVALPSFWLGILFILLFGVRLGWLPPAGFVSFFDNPVQAFRYQLLPAISLGIAMAAVVMRQTRSGLLEVLAQDFVRTARAKGLAERTVIVRHALRNAMLPVITVIGLEAKVVLGGAVIVEFIFGIPGMGSLAVTAIMNRDFPTLQGIVLVIATVVIVVNIFVDLAYGFLDPRIGTSRAAAAR